jgi:rhamnose transport system ATP-binding protein
MSSDSVSLSHISKAFGGVQALRDVSLDLRAGEVHALCGENGAGKSTLIKILSGVYTPDTGTVTAWDTALPTGSVPASEHAGIAVIHQESTAFPDLSAVDNIFVGREHSRLGGILLDRSRMAAETRGLLARVGLDIDPWTPLREFPLATRQLVAIARALSHDCRLLVLDEPTASLSSRETDRLFRIISELTARNVGVLYVSHRLEEVFQLSRKVSVLRDGEWVGTRPTAEVRERDLIRMMVGREVRTQRLGAAVPATGDPLLVARGLGREPLFRDVDLEVRAGEIVGLGGLVGAGRTELARCLFGLDRPTSGTVTLCGRVLPPGQVRTAIRQGLAMVPEDRQHEGLILPLSVGENIVSVALRTLADSLFLDRERERDRARQMISTMNVRTDGAAVPASTLSGGNQQKVVLAKWLAPEPRVLILDEPTRGVDVGAKAEIHRRIRELADAGMATLLISSDLPELLTLSDRILVMGAGRITGELPGDRASQEEILALALPAGAQVRE